MHQPVCSGCQRIVDMLEYVLNVLRQLAMQKSVQTVLDGLMHPFIDGVCLWVFLGSWDSLDSSPFQLFLETATKKLIALIVNAPGWSWVT
jgi:hypothetical protein